MSQGESVRFFLPISLNFSLYFQQWIINESYCLQERNDQESVLSGACAIEQHSETDQDMSVLPRLHLWSKISMNYVVQLASYLL